MISVFFNYSTMFLSYSHQASLTVWWIILRFMGDLPEPKKQIQGNPRQERFLPRDLVSRQDRRFSHMVGLDQVNVNNVNFDPAYCCRFT